MDDDENVRILIQRVLRAPEFEVHLFADPRDALMKLHDLRPDLIVSDLMMPTVEGGTFLKVVKRSAELRAVPFVVLSGIHADETQIAMLDDGADDFITKPFSAVKFLAKVRALLRMADRLTDVDRSGSLAGALGPAGALPLLKFCEDHRLTGRLSIEWGGRTRWAEFLGGELAQAGPEGGDDPLDTLMGMDKGHYRIEQKRLDAESLKQAESRVPTEREGSASAPEGPPPLPAGRLAMVVVRGEQVQVQTEAQNSPNFTVTTVLVRSGQVLRRTESAWPHALQRREDAEEARAAVERQHDRVVATLKGLSSRTEAPATAPSVEASLMAWVVSFVAEQARSQLGAVMTVAVLRRTQKGLAEKRPVLAKLRVTEDGRAEVEEKTLPRDAVEAVAAWVARFLWEAGSLAEPVRALKIDQATRMMEPELEKAGFYAAFEAAWARLGGTAPSPA